MNSGLCGSCNSAIEWVELDTGKTMPLDYGGTYQQATPRPGMVVVNPATQRGHVLSQADLEHVGRWLEQGARLYVTHFATCIHADRHRKAGQMAMGDKES